MATGTGFVSKPRSVWAAQKTSPPPIWFSPRYDASPGELLQLFDVNSDWKEAATNIAVFELGGVVARKWPESDIRTMIANLKRRQMTLCLGLSPLSGNGTCGIGVEAYNAPEQPFSNAARMKALGADIAYACMDEPLYFGHVYKGPNACRSSIRDIAREVAAKVQAMRRVYPRLQVGDVEPVGIEYPTWIPDVEQWLSEYRITTGSELAFFRADIQWHASWRNQMQALAALLRARGIPLQVIYNGNAHSDAEWNAQAVQRFQSYETSGLPRPDAVVFECWTANPTHVLPETNPTSLTGLVKRYIDWRQSP